MLYLIFKWLHVLLAIVAVGANLTYGLWIARASANAEHLPFTLRGIKLIDDRLANPAYGLLLVTGLLMVFTAPLPLSTPWLATALGLYVVLLLVGLVGYTPTLRGQIKALEEGGAESAKYRALAGRGLGLGIVLAVLTIAIVFLMVVKPTLWG